MADRISHAAHDDAPLSAAFRGSERASTVSPVVDARETVLRTCLAVLAIVGAVSPGPFTAAADPPYDWKLTLGQYFYSGYSGTDANLRWRGEYSSR